MPRKIDKSDLTEGDYEPQRIAEQRTVQPTKPKILSASKLVEKVRSETSNDLADIKRNVSTLLSNQKENSTLLLNESKTNNREMLSSLK
jgi:hypothetical protein